MKTYVCSLKRGDDLYRSILDLVDKNHIHAGYVCSAVGCLSIVSFRDASGITMQKIKEDVEILSVHGTIGNRCHLHISVCNEQLHSYGGHLVEGCIVNTTCELILQALDEYIFEEMQDEETGYGELLIKEDVK